MTKTKIELTIEDKLINQFKEKYPKGSLSLFLEMSLQSNIGYGMIAKFQEAEIKNGIEVSFK